MSEFNFRNAVGTWINTKALRVMLILFSTGTDKVKPSSLVLPLRYCFPKAVWLCLKETHIFLLKAENASFLSGWEFYRISENSGKLHVIVEEKKPFTMYDNGDGWKVSSYLSSHERCAESTARLYPFSKAKGRGKHIHFNTISSGKETLETGMICNSEKHFQNPSSMASSKLHEKCSQCNKAEILTTKVKMHRTGERELNYSLSLKRDLGKRTALATANTNR